MTLDDVLSSAVSVINMLPSGSWELRDNCLVIDDEAVLASTGSIDLGAVVVMKDVLVALTGVVMSIVALCDACDDDAAVAESLMKTDHVRRTMERAVEKFSHGWGDAV